MKNENKNNDNCAKQAYVPASVKVIEVNTQRVLCDSGGSSGTNDGFDHIQ